MEVLGTAVVNLTWALLVLAASIAIVLKAQSEVIRTTAKMTKLVPLSKMFLKKNDDPNWEVSIGGMQLGKCGPQWRQQECSS